jgi:hypothetical protein
MCRAGENFNLLPRGITSNKERQAAEDVQQVFFLMITHAK